MNMKLSNQALPSMEEFKLLIESIGFRLIEGYEFTYEYNAFKISLWGEFYYFWDGYLWIYNISLNDLTPIEKYFKNYFRNIKLKNILE